MRVACEPLPMRPITKHLPEPLRPCHCCPPALSPVNRPTGLPPTWQVSEREERKTGSSGTSRMVTSLRHVIYLPAELFPFLAILLVCRRTTTCISYYYSTTVPMHLHIITTSPQKGPTRPAAAPRELLQSDLLTVYPPYLDVNRRGRQAIRDVQLPNPTPFLPNAAAATRRPTKVSSGGGKRYQAKRYLTHN
jgi:hypothetical protein